MQTREKEAEPEVTDVPGAAKILGVCLTTAYAAVRSGDIPSIRIGRSIRVPMPALRRMLEGQRP